MMAPRSKLLFVITDFGSFNTFLSELSLHLIKYENFDISVICSPQKIINLEDKYTYQQKNLNFYYVDIPRGFNIVKQIKASFAIERLIKEINPDLVHIHLTTGIFTTILAKRSRKETWGTFHGLGFVVSNGYRKLIFYMIEMLCFSRIDKIIVLNQIDFEKIPRLFKKKAYKSLSLGLGCDLETFDSNLYTENKKTSIRISKNIESSFVLTFVGRFVYFKGFDIVARTFFKLAEEFNGCFKLILIGGIDPAHKTGLTVVEEKKLFNHKDVINVGFTNQVNDFLAITDLFFFPSQKEGVPICITEALAMGVPVLTVNSRGCNELVKNDFNGVVIDIDKSSRNDISKKCYDSIIYLKKNPGYLNELKANTLKSRNILSRNNFILENQALYKNYLSKKHRLLDKIY